MYELIILSILMNTTAHGYLIAKVINDIFGPYARISNGRLYPLLTHLEEEGIIEASIIKNQECEVAKGGRQHRNYRITKAGKERFHRLMMDTSSNPGEYQRIFFHKVSALSLLSQEEQFYLIDHYINYCQAHVLHLKAEAEEMEREKFDVLPPAKLQLTLSVLRHMQNQWLLDVEWAQQLREQMAARPDFFSQQTADEQSP